MMHRVLRDSCFGHSPKLIFDIKNVNFYAADYNGAKSFSKKKSLVFNLTKEPHKSNIYSILELHSCLDYSFDEIVMGWEDGDIPAVKPQFWTKFLNYVAYKDYSDVCTHCLMGHGRTGTTMAALLVVAKAVSAEEAIITIRDKYCKKAVETDRQIKYVFEIDEFANQRPMPEEISVIGSSFSMKDSSRDIDGYIIKDHFE